MRTHTKTPWMWFLMLAVQLIALLHLPRCGFTTGLLYRPLNSHMICLLYSLNVLPHVVLRAGGSWTVWYFWGFNDNCACNDRSVSLSYTYISHACLSSCFNSSFDENLGHCYVQLHKRLLMVLPWRTGEEAVVLGRTSSLAQLVLQRY